MRNYRRMISFVLGLAVFAASFVAQSPNAAVGGRVFGRDGTTPLQGVVIWIDSFTLTADGRRMIRERLSTST